MVRVSNLDQSLDFYCGKLGLREIRRYDNPQGRYTLVFVAAPGDESAFIELTFNWDAETYSGGRNFGHIAYEVDDIYATCERLMQTGVTINRPPRDGRMAFVRSPDQISIELLQKGKALPPQEPWISMPNTGQW
jgi:lactoylglutathione lyase